MKQSLTQLAQFFLFVCLCVAPNTAQTPEVVAPSVAAAASSEQARFLADNEVTNIRLEVFTLSDTRLYDSDFKAGNLLDWQWQDQQGQRLADGAYRCVITTQDLTGRSSQRQGLLLMQNSQAIWQAPEQAEAALRNTTVARAAEGMAYFATVTNPAELAAAVLAHDGTDARLMTGSGGLSVRTGNFLKGDEQEKLRLTAEGKLEVKGAISTGEGVVFPDGTVQKTAYVASGQTLKQIAEDGKKLSPNAPAVGGSGTANVLMKWAANGVDATNSSVTDLGPGGGITVNGSVLSSFNNVSATGDTVGGYMGFWPTGTSRALLLRSASLSGNLWIGHLGNVGLGFSDPGSRFATGGNATVGASLYNTAAPTNGLLVQGNVGIGTTAPTAPLEVNGLLRSTRSNVAPQYIQLNGGDSASIRLTAQSNVAAEKPLLIQNLSGDAVPGANNSIFFQTGTTASYSTKMMIDSVGRVGIGTTTPGYPLHVSSSGNAAIYAISNTDGVIGVAAGGGIGVRGIGNGSSSVGVYGDTPTGFGVLGTSTSGRGVEGVSTSGEGVIGSSTSSSGVFGQSGVASLTEAGVTALILSAAASA